LTALQTRYCTAHERLRAARAAELTLAALTIIQAMRRDYQNANGCAACWIMTTDRGNAQSSAQSGAAQWVLYKLDGGIDHLLIDEAQTPVPRNGRLCAN